MGSGADAIFGIFKKNRRDFSLFLSALDGGQLSKEPFVSQLTLMASNSSMISMARFLRCVSRFANVTRWRVEKMLQHHRHSSETSKINAKIIASDAKMTEIMCV